MATPWRAANHRALAVVAIFGAVGAISVLLTPQVHLITDMRDYDSLGLHLAERGRYALTGDALSAWRVPGYPLFLAAVYRLAGHSTLLVRILQVIVACGVVWGTYRLAAGLLDDARSAIWAAGLVALCPSTLIFAHLLLTETLFTALLVAALLAAFAWRQRSPLRYLAVGALLGAAALVRPIGLFSLLTLPILLWRERQLPTAVACRTAAALLGIVVVMSPWWYRNGRVFHTMIPTDLSAGPTLFVGNNERATGRSDYSLASRAFASVTNEVARDRMARQQALRFIRNRPWLFLRRLPSKAMAIWGLDRQGIYSYRAGFWGPPRRVGILVMALGMLGIAVLMPLALAGICSAETAGAARWMLWPILTFWLVGALSAPGARIHAPLVPALAVLAGQCLAERRWALFFRRAAVTPAVVTFWAANGLLVAYWAREILAGLAQIAR